MFLSLSNFNSFAMKHTICTHIHQKIVRKFRTRKRLYSNHNTKKNEMQICYLIHRCSDLIRIGKIEMLFFFFLANTYTFTHSWSQKRTAREVHVLFIERADSATAMTAQPLTTVWWNDGVGSPQECAMTAEWSFKCQKQRTAENKCFVQKWQ